MKKDLFKLEDIHDATIKENSQTKMGQKQIIEVQRDEIDIKSKEIEKLVTVETNDDVETANCKSLEEELQTN